MKDDDCEAHAQEQLASLKRDNFYRDWSKEDAINHAVKMTEKYIAENVANNKLPPAQREPVGCEGAIVNGRVYADRLEHDYKFECEAGPLHLCADWVELRRCFEWLAQHTSPPAQRTWVGLVWGELPKDGHDHDFLRGATWAEAKLKEKNA